MTLRTARRRLFSAVALSALAFPRKPRAQESASLFPDADDPALQGEPVGIDLASIAR